MNLRKLATVLLTAVAMLGCAAQPKQPVSPSSEVSGVDNALSATVVLYDVGSDLVCAGTRISPTELLTAFHCVVAAALQPSEAEAIEKSDPDYKNQRPEFYEGRDIVYATYEDVLKAGYDGAIRGQMAYVSRMDFAHDIAVLSTSPSGQASVKLREHDLGVGDAVFSIGHPYGLEFSFARGYISNQCRYLNDDTCWTQADISIYGGSSGGGLYDADGRLCGVASMRINAVYGFFVPPDAVARLVRTPSQ